MPTARMERDPMKQNIVLICSSLLSILLTTIHLADDVARGFERGGVAIFVGVPILVVWLHGTLVLAGRRSGCVIVLLGSLLGTVAPIVHVRGTHGIVGSESAQS